ncbi:MAG: hypothetical protein H6Q07_916 [Acidobacteria bacterium]|nr:hypothetical protein [Acidobacteriota bacterium]
MRPWVNSAAIILLLCLLPVNPAGSFQAQKESGSGIIVQYGPPRELSLLKDERIDESSGIAASIRYPGAFWTHNDSGDSARVFLIDKSGKTLATVSIKGASAVDWEDIASFKLGKESYVLIADAGDNVRRRETCVLYVVREPEIDIYSGVEEPSSIEAEPVLQISFSYEDGPHDCEAVAVDPTTSIIYLVSKEPGESRVYCMPFPTKESKDPNVAKAVATLNMQFPTAMDISPDGKRAVILTYVDAYEFSRVGEEAWAQAFSREPRLIKAPARKQGESICYGPDGRTLYLTSEKEHQPLWEIPVVEGAKNHKIPASEGSQ